MTKKEAKKLLKEHGIKLKFVTPIPFYHHQQDLARKMYGIPEDCVVPIKEQYQKIIDIIGEDGLYAIMKEYIVHDYFNIWSCSEIYSSSAWYLCFNYGYSGHANWYTTSKANGHSFAFWEFPKESTNS